MAGHGPAPEKVGAMSESETRQAYSPGMSAGGTSLACGPIPCSTPKMLSFERLWVYSLGENTGKRTWRSMAGRCEVEGVAIFRALKITAPKMM
jgi:hypothetical protein